MYNKNIPRKHYPSHSILNPFTNHLFLCSILYIIISSSSITNIMGIFIH